MEESVQHAHVAQYGPMPVTDVKAGETKYWCRCGLSKNQPWCDGSHQGTSITPLPWKVEGNKDTYYICCCKHTKNPPYCDGTHATLKEEVDKRHANCPIKDGHADCKLCTGCGKAADF